MSYVTRADFKAGIDGMQAQLADFKVGMNGIQAQIRRLAAEQIKMRAVTATKADIEALRGEFRAMYQIALEASERARASFNKLLAHGDMLQDHEGRLRTLERKPS